MQGVIKDVEICEPDSAVIVTYELPDGRMIRQMCSYTEVRWRGKSYEYNKRIAYATAEATRRCVEEMSRTLSPVPPWKEF